MNRPRVAPRGLLWMASLLLAGVLLGLTAGCPEPLSDVEKHVRDGNALFQSGDYESAEEAFDRALRLRPDQAGTLVNRGNARMMLGRTHEAMADYDAALRADPRLGAAYANRGILKDRLGDEAGAMADYRKALELQPGLGEGPGLWERIIRNPPTETIRQRLRYLETKHGTSMENRGPG